MSFPPPPADPDTSDLDPHDEPDAVDDDDELVEPACTICKDPLADEFYRVGGYPVCPDCRDVAERAAQGGSGLARFLRAAILGGLACVLTAVAFFWSTRYLGISLAVFAIPVGYAISAAVRKGTGDRGGLIYQLMAIGLIYVSIGLTFTAVGLGRAIDEGAKRNRALAQARLDDNEDPDDADAAAPKAVAAPAAPPPKADLPDPKQLIQAILALGRGLGWLVLMVPLWFCKETPALGLCMILAMASAWKMNRRQIIPITGPFPTDELLGDADRPAPAIA